MEWQTILALLLVAVGIIGSVLPMLPGVPLVFAGLLLAAWHGDFARVGILSMVIIGAIGVLAWAVDFFASIVTAKKVGASKNALIGAGLGAVLGIFAGLPGLILGPAIGAVIGELTSHSSKTKATVVGVAAGLGFVLAMVIKLLLILVMLAIFGYAYYN